jgi:hypothetical protein
LPRTASREEERARFVELISPSRRAAGISNRCGQCSYCLDKSRHQPVPIRHVSDLKGREYPTKRPSLVARRHGFARWWGPTLLPPIIALELKDWVCPVADLMQEFLCTRATASVRLSVRYRMGPRHPKSPLLARSGHRPRTAFGPKRTTHLSLGPPRPRDRFAPMTQATGFRAHPSLANPRSIE